MSATHVIYPGPRSMRLRRVDEVLRAALVGLLALFVFVLPLVEAPKNIAVGLYFAVWLVRAWLVRDFGPGWRWIDTAFALYLGSAALSAFAGYAGDLSGVLRVVLLAWLASRAPMTEHAARLVAAAACLGLLVALPLGAVPFFLRQTDYFELPSVGHVNQSAIYIALLATATFGWWLQGAHAGQGGWKRWALGAAATLFGTVLLISASRAAVLGGAVAAVVVGAAVAACATQGPSRQVLRRAALALLGVLAVVVTVATVAPQLSAKKLTPAELLTTDSMGTRVQNWRLAYDGWRQRPWVGHGPDGYQRVTVEDVCRWRQDRGETCDPAQYLRQTHAHSIYIGTLVERGVVGMLALGCLLFTWAALMLRARASAFTSGLWVASTVALVVVVVTGVFNTTLRVEHGSLALLWLGMWAAAQAPARASP